MWWTTGRAGQGLYKNCLSAQRPDTEPFGSLSSNIIWHHCSSMPSLLLPQHVYHSSQRHLSDQPKQHCPICSSQQVLALQSVFITCTQKGSQWWPTQETTCSCNTMKTPLSPIIYAHPTSSPTHMANVNQAHPITPTHPNNFNSFQTHPPVPHLPTWTLPLPYYCYFA